jgi:hypothetical protein
MTNEILKIGVSKKEIDINKILEDGNVRLLGLPSDITIEKTKESILKLIDNGIKFNVVLDIYNKQWIVIPLQSGGSKDLNDSVVPIDASQMIKKRYHCDKCSKNFVIFLNDKDELEEWNINKDDSIITPCRLKKPLYLIKNYDEIERLCLSCSNELENNKQQWDAILTFIENNNEIQQLPYKVISDIISDMKDKICNNCQENERYTNESQRECSNCEYQH